MNRLLPVTDPDDPRVAPYRAIRDRDVAGHGGRFVAEGALVVRRLLSGESRFSAESVLVAAGSAGRLPPEIAGASVPVYAAERAVMDGIVGFPIHRGILAMGLRRPEPSVAALLADAPSRALALLLVGIANHDNVGGVFRNAAAFGARAVLLDAGSCDPLYRKAIRVSVGACLTVPFGRARHAERGSPEGSAAALIADARLYGFTPVALAPRAATTVDRLAWPDRTLLVVGAEGPGLPAGLLAECPGVAIPMTAGFDSLNLATATGIALHGWRSRQGGD